MSCHRDDGGSHPSKENSPNGIAFMKAKKMLPVLEAYRQGSCLLVPGNQAMAGISYCAEEMLLDQPQQPASNRELPFRAQTDAVPTGSPLSPPHGAPEHDTLHLRFVLLCVYWALTESVVVCSGAGATVSSRGDQG